MSTFIISKSENINKCHQRLKKVASPKTIRVAKSIPSKTIFSQLNEVLLAMHEMSHKPLTSDFFGGFSAF